MTGRLRCFLVDDEAPALARLERLLAATGRVVIAGTATDPGAAAAALASDPVDIAFLDVEMPEMSGLELAARLPRGTAVVFVTAYDRYALQAFEASSIDYLLKPVDRRRLDRALDKLEALRAAPGAADPAALEAAFSRLADILAEREAAPKRLASRLGNRVALLDPAEISHIFARDKLTLASSAGKEHALDAPISELEQRLAPLGFIRVHRSTLVNIAWIAELRPAAAGRATLVMRDGRTELSVSRERVKPLRRALGLT